MRRTKIFSGSSHEALARRIARRLGVDLGQVKLGMTRTFETHVVLQESVREEDVYIVQSCAGDVNDLLMELLVMIHDCKIASAQRITAVLPYLPYCKQSKKKHSRGGVTAKLVANMLKMAGVDHIVTIDLHASQIQGFFTIPVDNLLAEPSIARYLKTNVIGIENAIVVAKNAGATKRVTSLADRLRLGFALLHKETTRLSRNNSSYCLADCEHTTLKEDSSSVQSNPSLGKLMSVGEQQGEFEHGDGTALDILSQKPTYDSTLDVTNVKEILTLVGDVKDRIALLADDILDSCPSFIIAADYLKKRKHATSVIIVVTHAVLTEDMARALQNTSSIDQVIATDTIPIPKSVISICNKIHLIDISDILAEAIRRNHNGESISQLFTS